MCLGACVRVRVCVCTCTIEGFKLIGKWPTVTLYSVVCNAMDHIHNDDL